MVGPDNDISYQALKLFNFSKQKLESHHTYDLKLVGIGGDTG
jgi:hypothetical protein